MEPPSRRPILSRTPLSLSLQPPWSPVLARVWPLVPPASGRPAIDPHTLQRCRPRAVVPTPSSATELCVVSSTAGSSVGADAAATLPWAATPPRCQVDPGGWLQRGSEPPPSSSSRQGEMGRRGREGKPLLAVARRGGPCRPWQGGEEDGFWSHRWRSMFF
jgi:hypothetical protein